MLHHFTSLLRDPPSAHDVEVLTQALQLQIDSRKAIRDSSDARLLVLAG